MQIDFTWPIPLVSTVTYNRHVLSPSSSCPLKISLSLHPQTSKVILRCASATLADPRTALPSSLLSVCLPCQAEKTHLLYVCCKSPQLTLFLNSMHTHNHIYTQACMDTHTLAYTLADRNTSGEPMKIWVAQQEQGVWIYSDWCFVLTFSDNGWEIMETADIQGGDVAAAAWCLSWSRLKRTGLMMVHLRLNCGCDLLRSSSYIIIKSMVSQRTRVWSQINAYRILQLESSAFDCYICISALEYETAFHALKKLSTLFELAHWSSLLWTIVTVQNTCKQHVGQMFQVLVVTSILPFRLIAHLLLIKYKLIYCD